MVKTLTPQMSMNAIYSFPASLLLVLSSKHLTWTLIHSKVIRIYFICYTYNLFNPMRLSNAFNSIFFIWFWFKYRYRNPGKLLNASDWIDVIWFSLRKIECSCLLPLNAYDGTSIKWLYRRSLWKKERKFVYFAKKLMNIF